MALWQLGSDGHGAPRLSAATEMFLAQDALCTLTTCRPDGSPHVTPTRFTWDNRVGLARVMTVGSRRKVRNILASPRAWASLCQLVGYSWVTLEGPATVSDDPARVDEGARHYLKRYRSSPPDLPGLVVIEIAVERVMGQH
jgi:PPOX class probable F420-dependent enzyme